MLEAAGDLGLLEKPGTAVGVVGVVVLDALEGDFTLQLLVERGEDLAEAAPGVRAEDAEPGSARCWCAWVAPSASSSTDQEPTAISKRSGDFRHQ